MCGGVKWFLRHVRVQRFGWGLWGGTSTGVGRDGNLGFSDDPGHEIPGDETGRHRPTQGAVPHFSILRVSGRRVNIR